MSSLSFNSIQFHPIQQNDDQIWLTAAELADALGYSRTDKINQIYKRKEDEFSISMTQLVANSQNLNLRLRIFSLRGCHLIAMFARTPVAKEFRKWVHSPTLQCKWHR